MGNLDAPCLVNVSVAVVVPFAGSVKTVSVQVIFAEVGIPHVPEARPPGPPRPPLLIKVRIVEAE
jgi:hypothetical protein